jgi:hypothetical protein
MNAIAKKEANRLVHPAGFFGPTKKNIKQIEFLK